MRIRIYILILLGIALHSNLLAQQDTIRLTLFEAIDIAQKQSPDISVARHSFRSSYWNYSFYKANYLPTVTFTSTPNFNHQINPITMPDGTTKYIGQNQLTTDANISISQNIQWTGGILSVKTGLQRLDLFGDDKAHMYKSNPVTISYEQSLFGYNALKWDKRIEPLKYEEAKKTYIENLELVATRTINMFFGLATAQTNLEIARTNYANADTLYSFAKRRYDIGTITENEMLQLEVNRLNEETNMLNAEVDVEDKMQLLRSYLGIIDIPNILVKVPSETPQFAVNIEDALALATSNSPDILTMERRRKESESNVAYAKSISGLKADIFAQLGLTQTGEKLDDAYNNPMNQQYVQIGIRLPILDWGRGKGRVRVAESNRDMIYTQVEQDRTDFELNIAKIVRQFNLQNNRVRVALKTDETAHRRNEVARKLYILGKSNILDLNAAITEKDTAKRNYINSIQNYWVLCYTLRSLTLYDFEKKLPIVEDYSLLLK